MNEHLLRNGEYKIDENGNLLRKATQAGEPIWVNLSSWVSPFEKLLIEMLREVLDR